ncbi:MAG: succinate dehydrogenase, cytochrome b556 subunit [Caldilineales bacterium]|nr:succinate dehydrogenase, cytochrome b556 subunit [Caldilineales bacterium]MDW8319313.1 succinate dehydrogenase, cytochrome b556 subunit [Anaerolineae bacterium]
MYTSSGFISFALRRLTGIALVIYLFMHMWVIGSVNAGPEAFNARLNFFQQPFFKLMEVALLAAVVFHAVDGIRVMVVHYTGVTEYRKSMFYAVLIVSVLLVIAGGVPIIRFILEGK